MYENDDELLTPATKMLNKKVSFTLGDACLVLLLFHLVDDLLNGLLLHTCSLLKLGLDSFFGAPCS